MLATAFAAELTPWVQLGATGVVCAIAYRLVVVTIPKMHEEERKANREQVDAFITATKQQRDEFRQDLAAQREQSSRLATEGHKAVAALAASTDRLHGAVLQALEKAMRT